MAVPGLLWLALAVLRARGGPVEIGSSLAVKQLSFLEWLEGLPSYSLCSCMRQTGPV